MISYKFHISIYIKMKDSNNRKKQKLNNPTTSLNEKNENQSTPNPINNLKEEG